jgi:hypothetical protein
VLIGALVVGDRAATGGTLERLQRELTAAGLQHRGGLDDPEQPPGVAVGDEQQVLPGLGAQAEGVRRDPDPMVGVSQSTVSELGEIRVRQRQDDVDLHP